MIYMFTMNSPLICGNSVGLTVLVDGRRLGVAALIFVFCGGGGGRRGVNVVAGVCVGRLGIGGRPLVKKSVPRGSVGCIPC